MHEAPGSPLSPDSSGGDAPETSSPAPRRRAWIVFAIVGLLLYGLDLLTKELALARLEGEGRVPLIGDLLGLRLAFNPGAAFSLGTNFTPIISLIAIVAALVVLVLSRRLGSTLWAVAFGFLFAGITGNLTDRLFRAPGPFHGHVVDMIELPNWPIFNVADMCINVAAALIIVQAFRGLRLDGSRVPSDGDDEADEATA